MRIIIELGATRRTSAETTNWKRKTKTGTHQRSSSRLVVCLPSFAEKRVEEREKESDDAQRRVAFLLPPSRRRIFQGHLLNAPSLFCTTLHHRPPCITVHIPRILHVQNVTPVETLFRAHTKTTRVQLVPFTDSLQALCCLTSRQTSSIDLSHRSDHIATTRQGWKAQGCHFVAWCHSKDGVTIT